MKSGERALAKGVKVLGFSKDRHKEEEVQSFCGAAEGGNCPYHSGRPGASSTRAVGIMRLFHGGVDQIV